MITLPSDIVPPFTPAPITVIEYWLSAKVAVAVRGDVTVKLHVVLFGPLSESHPVQFDKVEPVFAAAVIEAGVALNKLPLHEMPPGVQFTPIVLLEKLPLPVPFSPAEREYTE